MMEMGRRGSTIGKGAFNLLVTRENGAPLNFGNALGRNIIKVLSIFILPIAVLVMLLSRRRQGIHDRIAGTVVVREDSASRRRQCRAASSAAIAAARAAPSPHAA
jgi:uncharacterized RDD family membrane protein YckC